MNKYLKISFVSALFGVVFSIDRNVLSYSSGPPTGSTNAPLETSCATNMLCHNGIPNAGNGGTILSVEEDISNGYVPGNTYTVMPFVFQSGSSKIGFQTVALHSNGNGAGSVTISNSKTQMNSSAGKEYVTHTASGNFNVGMHDWMYEWTAPAAGSGTVTIYGAFVASNNNMAASGDSIYTDSLVINENTSGIREYYKEKEFEIFQERGNNGIFHLEKIGNGPPVNKITIININGKRIFEITPPLFEFPIIINLTSQPAGIYFAEIFKENKNCVLSILRM